MARIFTAGFEGGTGDITKFSGIDGANVISSSGLDMDGSYCLACDGGSDFARISITADDEMYFAFLYRCSTIGGSGNALIGFYSDATLLGRLVTAGGTSNVMQAMSGSSTLLASSAQALAENTTYFVEVYYKLADSGGRFAVKLNNISAIDFTGDTKPSTQTTFNGVVFGISGSTLSYGYFDNIILDDADWIGKTYIQGLAVTGAGTTTQFTPSAGANYACVDEIPVSTTDYISTNTNDHLDTYALANLTGTLGLIKSVSVNAYAIKEGSATPQNLKLAMLSGSTTDLSAGKAIPTSYAVLSNIWETDPDTSSAWDESGVNALEVGVKSAA